MKMVPDLYMSLDRCIDTSGKVFHFFLPCIFLIDLFFPKQSVELRVGSFIHVEKWIRKLIEIVTDQLLFHIILNIQIERNGFVSRCNQFDRFINV